MPNIAATFRQEIIRLARKEIRNEAQPLRKASAQFRRKIADLKRQATKLKAEVARLEYQVSQDVAPQVAETVQAGGRYSAKSVIAQRKRLGLSAADFGKIVGVTAQTIFNWEHGGSRPRPAQIDALRSVRSLGKRDAINRLEQLQEKTPKKRVAKR